MDIFHLAWWREYCRDIMAQNRRLGFPLPSPAHWASLQDMISRLYRDKPTRPHRMRSPRPLRTSRVKPMGALREEPK